MPNAATAIASAAALALGWTTVSAQATRDRENRYSNVGALMVWRVDSDEILVAPLQPGIADVGLVFLAHAPPGVTPARLAAPNTLARSRGRADDDRGLWDDYATKAGWTAGYRGVGWQAPQANIATATSGRRDVGTLGYTELRLLR